MRKNRKQDSLQQLYDAAISKNLYGYKAAYKIYRKLK